MTPIGAGPWPGMSSIRPGDEISLTQIVVNNKERMP
jgi:hypothetical protein